MNSSTDSILKVQVQRVFLEMKNKSAGKQLLYKLGIDNFELPQEQLYDSASTIYTTVTKFRERKTNQ